MAFSPFTRRDFLRTSVVGATASSVIPGVGMPSLLASVKESKAKACILLWLGGGPSQKETFDPKPNSQHPGDYKPIQTSVPGIHITELFPKMAKIMQHAAILRSVKGAGDHNRGTYFAHTGVPLASGGLVYPTLGSVVSATIDRPPSELPRFVMLGGMRYGASPGFLGASHAPLQLTSLAKVQELFTQKTDGKQLAREMSLLEAMEKEFQQTHDVPTVDAHRKTVQAAARFMHARDLKAFDLSLEKAATREVYGNFPGDRNSFDFCQGCLIARRLVEVGVPFVEVKAGEWDHHNNIATRIKEVGRPLDTAVSALVNDLKDRGMLDSTLIVMLGEMGRGPTIPPAGANYSLGRHHWGHVMSVVVLGGGVKGGQVMGKTDKEGGHPEERPVSVLDLLATIYTQLGIDHTKDHKVELGGRPVPILKKSAQPIQELIA